MAKKQESLLGLVLAVQGQLRECQMVVSSVFGTPLLDTYCSGSISEALKAGSEAIQRLKDLHIIVEVQGGLVSDVVSTENIRCELFDFDTTAKGLSPQDKADSKILKLKRVRDNLYINGYHLL